MNTAALEGARNLIVHAVGASPGESLAVIAEDPAHGMYDGEVPRCIAAAGEALGVRVEIVPVGLHAGLADIPPAVGEALERCDHVVFHTRLGDTLRFDAVAGGATKTIAYALDIGLLAGEGCTLPHPMMQAIGAAYERRADAARAWRLTCPLGTDLAGEQDIEAVARGAAPDFTLGLFPLCSPRPISGAGANGTVAVAHWLMATDNHPYDDGILMLPEPVFATVEDGRIVRWSGEATLVARVEAHYARVAALFGIDGGIVHSWHGGMNPGVFYPRPATEDVERWGKVAFANPRYMHIHTCGDYAPGEIAWSLFDATVTLDGTTYWQDGRFVFLEDPEARAIAAAHGFPQGLPVRRDIGIDP